MDLGSFAGRSTVIASLRHPFLRLALLRRGRIEKTAEFMTREMSRDALRDAAVNFLGGASPARVLAVLPRAEILQKEFSLAKGTEEAVKEELDARLQKMLPFSASDMAWGLRMEPEAAVLEGLLMAAPEKKVREVLELLRDIGLASQDMEVITDDQTLLWAALAQKQAGPALVLEKDGPRILALFIKSGRLAFSRAFDAESPDAVSDAFSEVSLRFLESGENPAKILIAGGWTEEERALAARHFGTHAESLTASAPAAASAPPAFLYGASLYGKYPAISLLPKELKLEKRSRERFSALRGIGISAALLALLFSASFAAKLLAIRHAESGLEKRAAALSGSAAEAREMVAAARALRKAQDSKENILVLLKEIALNAPAEVRFRELRAEGGKIQFFGESPSYGPVSETVEMIEAVEAVGDAKLKGTRLRKAQGEQTLEFEVTGKWSI